MGACGDRSEAAASAKSAIAARSTPIFNLAPILALRIGRCFRQIEDQEGPIDENLRVLPVGAVVALVTAALAIAQAGAETAPAARGRLTCCGRSQGSLTKSILTVDDQHLRGGQPIEGRAEFPEAGGCAWDPRHPHDFYFVTTSSLGPIASQNRTGQTARRVPAHRGRRCSTT
jgi:hypothetical protein